MHQTDDYLIFGPDDVDLTRSPLRGSIEEPTFVLGAFNPALTRLPSGNLLLMVRVAEALSQPVAGDHVHAIRWTPDGYVLDPHRLDRVDLTDPRFFLIRGTTYPTMGLTSLSWLLPVELTPDGRAIVAVHYDRAIEPRAAYQDYGIEDPRISLIDGRYHMTVCCCSAERHGTALYTSDDGFDWTLHGLVLDHQNKDMLLFEGRIGGHYWALTRPLGELYFTYPEAADFAGGPVIHFASSPDALHWKPCDRPGLRARKHSSSAMKVGGGTPPILTEAGWLILYHGVEPREKVGVYRTFWALLDCDDPANLLRVEDGTPLIEADPALTAPISHQLYLPTPVVFTTGIVAADDTYVVASGEADLACRITHIAKTAFA